MEMTYQKLTTLKSRVRFCLEKYEETRNSDIELFTRVCEAFYPPFERPLYNWRDLAHAMHKVPNYDYLSRMRRNLIEESGYTKFLPTSYIVAMRRDLNEGVWLTYMRANNMSLDEFHRIKNPNSATSSNLPQGYNDEGELTGQVNS